MVDSRQRKHDLAWRVGLNPRKIVELDLRRRAALPASEDPDGYKVEVRSGVAGSNRRKAVALAGAEQRQRPERRR